ncbi:MAG: hypothetical protein NT144_08660 [Bacteroidia bacterium]|nr:hypothetical protein [Bacteroidia bacterium]
MTKKVYSQPVTDEMPTHSGFADANCCDAHRFTQDLGIPGVWK